jgi:UDP-glucose 4-epimerase
MTIVLSDCLPRIARSRVLVTGGAGFIGSHLVDFLAQHGAELIVVDDLSRARVDWLKSRRQDPRIHVVQGSILDEERLASVMPGVSAVYHLAAIATVMMAVRNPEKTLKVNTLGTAQVALAAQRAGVKRLVFSSSREVYGDPAALPVHEDAPIRPKNVYGASKAAAELFLNTLDNMEIVTLRLANVYGPGDSDRVIPIFLHNALNGLPLTLYGGQQALDLIWIGDVVETLVKAGFSDALASGPINVGSGMSTSVRSLAQRIADLVGGSMTIRLAPPRGPEVEHYQADLTRAGQYFGLQPKADPLEHLPEVLAALRTGMLEKKTRS